MSISFAEVSKTYGEGPTAVHALRQVDLEIPQGEFTVILGPSGSGKTTLLNMVGGIDEVTAGTVIVNDARVNDLDNDERVSFRRNQVGFVFQFFNLIPTLTALENVQLVAELTQADGEAQAQSVLEQVGLGDRGHHFPSQLSGGEQQRVAVARASRRSPRFCCATSPPVNSTSKPVAPSWLCSANSTVIRTKRFCWSRTTRPSARWPTGCCGCAQARSSTTSGCRCR